MKTSTLNSSDPRRPKHWRQTTAPSVGRSASSSYEASSEDGVVHLRVQATETGIFVERAFVHPSSALVVMDVHFDDAAQFGTWCNADPARFEYPMLFLSLKRHGCDLFP